jgi:hypothetical protein
MTQEDIDKIDELDSEIRKLEYEKAKLEKNNREEIEKKKKRRKHEK